MYIVTNNEWFEKRIAKDGCNYLYPKDEFLLSIWDKASESNWYNTFSKKQVNLTTYDFHSTVWSVNNPFNSEDDVFYFQPKSLIQLVKFDNLTDDEILYLSLKYNPIEVNLEEPVNNVYS